VRDRAQRHFNHWIPRATEATWIQERIEQDAKVRDVGAIGLLGPFAKDRNQLNGIGSHEMPLNWKWGGRHDGPGKPQPTFHVSNGDMDLRDAEFTFMTKAENLAQRGSALTFWIMRSADGEQGAFHSQWALTAAPFPDHALTNDGHWHSTTMTLSNDPRAWTYTGNNPKEQGARASRYSRLPLPDTIACVNDAFVLIFAYGDERQPPNGDLYVAEISAKLRDKSALSFAAGARLVAWPSSELCDPSNLVSGSRGYDEDLWTSGSAPQFPLEFEWSVSDPLNITSVQLNQHPYYPSKDVEILGAVETGYVWERIALVTMTDSVTDLLQPPYAHISVATGRTYTAIKLRILSGYRGDRCGLEGLEIYGTDVKFKGDGTPSTLSEEVPGFSPGEKVFFRLVVEDGDAATHVCGQPHTVKVPATQIPSLSAVTARRRADNPRCLVVRGNAMGQDAVLSTSLRLASGETANGPELDFGCQPTGRHIQYNLPADFPETHGTLRLVLRNAMGACAAELKWPPAWTD